MSSTKEATNDQFRKRRIGAIHGTAKRMGMEDDARKELQLRITGVASTAEMTLPQLELVVDELKRLGGASKPFDVHLDEPKDLQSRPMLRKVGALLADSGRPWAYVHGMSKRMFKTARVEWLRDAELHKVVAALQADANRRAEKCHTIEFEDNGQDFLEFDIDEHDTVVGCRPFQASVWCGSKVLNPDVSLGEQMRIRTKLGHEITLRHKVAALKATPIYNGRKAAKEAK